MKQTHYHVLIFIFIELIVCQLTTQQTTTDTVDLYPGVNVTDYTPTIPDETEKFFTTSLTLVKNFANVNFVDRTFTDAAAPVYTQLPGYNGIRNLKSTASGSTVRITYDAVYVFLTLRAFSTDTQIKAAIGELTPVLTGLQSNSNFLALFTVSTEESTFSFAGNSLCSSVSCNEGTYIACSESTDGSTITCVSPCKTGYCKNEGICTQESVNSSPVCACRTQSDLWYLGNQCQTMITLWMIILIAIGVFILILITIFIFCVCYWRKKRRKQRLQKEKEKMSYANKAYITDNDDIITTTIRENRNVSDDYHENPRYRDREYSERERSRERHRHRHRSHSGDRHRRHHRRRSYERSSSDAKKPPVDESSYESSSQTSEDQQQNIADYEIDVSEITTDKPQLEDQGTSPIRWLPSRESEPEQEVQTNPTVKGVNIRERPGWRPSLGPNMFDLKQSREELNHVGLSEKESDAEQHNEVAMPYGQGRFVGETDL